MHCEKKRNVAKRVTAVLTAAVLLAGLCVLLYPTIAGRWNARTMSRTVAAYGETVDSMSAKDRKALLAAAREYNERLYELGSAAALALSEPVAGYEEALDVTGTGIMGYVAIERLGIELPIYHGTDAGVLAAGAGHLEGSSLPVGGESTHAVISAHRGLPSALLFTHLDRMEEGDLFTITVLGETLTYEVDRITTVLPTEFEELYIEDGEDFCTLMTCTPYGINTHRLLVRGKRVDNPEGEAAEEAEADSFSVRFAALVIALLLVILLLILLLPIYRERKLS